MSQLSRRAAVAATVLAGATLIGTKAVAADSIKGDEVPDEKAKLKLRTATKQWRHFTGLSTLDDVIRLANINPPQGAGELVAVPMAGKFDALLYF
jgi:hypothetical protein